MWKRGEQEAKTTSSYQPTTVAPALNNTTEQNAKAIIGAEICVKGSISGAEDLLVLGSVEGTVDLGKNIVTVGKSGRVKASITAKTIHVEGEVEGDICGTEQVIVHRAGQVIGNITAPRVALEDGARVKGTIDTDSMGSSTSALANTVVSEKAQSKNGTTAVDTRPAANGAKPEARVN